MSSRGSSVNFVFFLVFTIIFCYLIWVLSTTLFLDHESETYMLLDKSSKIYIAHLYSYIAYSQAICYVGPVRSEI